MSFQNIQKALVIKLRHIGDVLLSAPVFRALKENFPGVLTLALVNKGTEDVLSGNPNIDEIVTYDRAIKGRGFPGRYLMELSHLSAIRSKRPDMSVDLTSGDRAALASLVSGARYRLAYDPEGAGFPGKKRAYTNLARKDPGRHMVLENLGLLSAFGIVTRDLRVDFHIPERARDFAKGVLKANGSPPRESTVHIHPTSRWLFKCWKDEWMAETISSLLKRGLKVVLTSSPDGKELDKAASIMSLLPPTARSEVVDLCGRTSIKELAAISEASGLFFGVDSAPMHIAAAVGTPVVALFGPSGAHNWGPWDNSAAPGTTPYDQMRGVRSFGPHTVIQSSRDCVPCGRDGCGGSKTSDCLFEITPDVALGVLASKGF